MAGWVIAAGVVFVALAVWLVVVLLKRITLWGGDRSDGLAQAEQFQAQANAFRNATTDADVAWDGQRRMKDPPPDGMEIGGW